MGISRTSVKIFNYSKLDLRQSYGVMALDSAYEYLDRGFANTMTFCVVCPAQEKEYWGYGYNFVGIVWLERFLI